MELILQDALHVNASELSAQDRLRFAIELAQTLAFLHRGQEASSDDGDDGDNGTGQAGPVTKATVHRDIKTANVGLIRNGEDDDDLHVVLLDFGAVRSVPQRAPYSQAQSQTHSMGNFGVIGTLGYIAPECQGLNVRYGVKSDVYAFGVVLMELMTSLAPLTESSTPLVTLWRDTPRQYLDTAMSLSNVGWDELILQGLGQIALDCTKANRDARPTMRDVAYRLLRLSGCPEPERALSPFLEPAPALCRQVTCEEQRPAVLFCGARHGFCSLCFSRTLAARCATQASSAHPEGKEDEEAETAAWSFFECPEEACGAEVDVGDVVKHAKERALVILVKKMMTICEEANLASSKLAVAQEALSRCSRVES